MTLHTYTPAEINEILFRENIDRAELATAAGVSVRQVYRFLAGVPCSRSLVILFSILLTEDGGPEGGLVIRRARPSPTKY